MQTKIGFLHSILLMKQQNIITVNLRSTIFERWTSQFFSFFCNSNFIKHSERLNRNLLVHILIYLYWEDQAVAFIHLVPPVIDAIETGIRLISIIRQFVKFPYPSISMQIAKMEKKTRITDKRPRHLKSQTVSRWSPNWTIHEWLAMK